MNMNESERLPLKSLQRICRTCLMSGDLFAICEVNWEGIELKDVMVNWILNIQIKEDDPLPRHMCRNCIKMMYKTYHFVLQCKKSEIILRKMGLTMLSNNPTIKQAGYKEKPPVVKVEDKYNKDNDLDVDPVGRWHGIQTTIESDNDIEVDDCENVESKTSDGEEPALATNSEGTIVQKINTVKEQITKMKVKNEVRLRQMAKAQLLDYNSLPNKKRSYALTKGPPYVCITCKSSFQTYQELKKHTIDAEHKKVLDYTYCEYCGKRFDYVSKYQEHVKEHTGEKPYECSTCGKSFRYKHDLGRHMTTHMEVKPYICRICNKDFTRKHYLASHERIHTGEKEFLCPHCGKGCHSSTSLYHHERTHKGLERTRTYRLPNGTFFTEDTIYQCHLCEKNLHNEYSLKAHLLLHGPKTFSCDICGGAYVTENRLQLHIEATHQGSRFACHVCKKEYKQKTGLVAHMKTHSGENDYPCDVCGKHFLRKASLFQHKRLHTGDTTYQCKECLKICITKRNLEGHLRTHTGEKPYACKYCDKCFAQRSNLIVHMKTHTGERNHQCKICDKAFFEMRGLKKHMAIHLKTEDIV